MFCPKGPRNNVPNNNNNNNNYNKLFKQLQWEILGYVWPKIFRTTRGTGLLMEYCIQLLSWLLVNFIGLDCGDWGDFIQLTGFVFWISIPAPLQVWVPATLVELHWSKSRHLVKISSCVDKCSEVWWSVAKCCSAVMILEIRWFNVYLTVHHSVDLFQITNLMHNSFIL